MALPTHSEYIFGAERSTWFEARAFCEDADLDLVSIHSDDGFEWMKDALNARSDWSVSFWIGLKHEGGAPSNSSTYSWSDGTPFDFGRDVSGGIAPWKEKGGINPNSLVDLSCIRLQNNAEWAWDDIACDHPSDSLRARPVCSNTTTDTDTTPSQIQIDPSNSFLG